MEPTRLTQVFCYNFKISLISLEELEPIMTKITGARKNRKYASNVNLFYVDVLLYLFHFILILLSQKIDLLTSSVFRGEYMNNKKN